jgi:hypothetical protein
MRAKTVNENVNFERGVEPIDSMKLGHLKKRQIQKAMSEFPESEIFDNDPHSFSMGFNYKNLVTFFIEINDTYDKNFVVGFEDLEIPSDTREEFDTIEECIEWIQNRKEFIDEENSR